MCQVISENQNACRNAQEQFCDQLIRILETYQEAFDIAESADWWKGNSKDEFLAGIEEKKREVEAIQADFSSEQEFYDWWDSHLKKIRDMFQDIPSFVFSLFGINKMWDEDQSIVNNASSYVDAAMGQVNGIFDSINSNLVGKISEINVIIEAIGKEREASRKKHAEWKEETDRLLSGIDSKIREIFEPAPEVVYTEEELDLLNGYNPDTKYTNPNENRR